MLSKEEIIQLKSDIESFRIERTVATKDTDKFCQAICAFSNDITDSRMPGYLLMTERTE